MRSQRPAQPGEHYRPINLQLRQKLVTLPQYEYQRIQNHQRTCYLSFILIEPIVFDDLDEFLNVLKAVSKYQMAVAVNALTQQVTSPRLKDKSHPPAVDV